MQAVPRRSFGNRIRYKNGVRFDVTHNGEWLDTSDTSLMPCKKCPGAKAYHQIYRNEEEKVSQRSWWTTHIFPRIIRASRMRC